MSKPSFAILIFTLCDIHMYNIGNDLQLGNLKVKCLLLKLNRKLRKMFLSPRRESNPQPSDFQWDALTNHCATGTQMAKRRLRYIWEMSGGYVATATKKCDYGIHMWCHCDRGNESIYILHLYFYIIYIYISLGFNCYIVNLIE